MQHSEHLSNCIATVSTHYQFFTGIHHSYRKKKASELELFLALVSRCSADVFPEVCKSSLEVCVVLMKLRSCIIHRCSGGSSVKQWNVLDLRGLISTSPVRFLPFGPTEAGSGGSFISTHRRADGGDGRNPILRHVQPRTLKSDRNTCRNAAEQHFWSSVYKENLIK